MSEATYWWPSKDQPGTYTIEHHSGAVWRDAYWNGVLWSNGHKAVEPLEVLAWGYLGVRREKPELEAAIYVSPDRSTLAAEALAAFRACKQQPQFADWAMEYGVELCQRLGAV